jgi:ribosomal protein S18 acetylase RimI-like enzyme
MLESYETLTAPVKDFRLNNWLATTESSDYQEALEPWGVDIPALRIARLLGGTNGEIRVLEKNGELEAILRTQKMDWDEAVLGMPVIRVDGMAGGGIEERRQLLSRAVVTLRPGRGLLTARVRGDDYSSMHALEGAGFRVADSMNIFLKDFGKSDVQQKMTKPKVGEIVEYNPDDEAMRAALSRLGADSFRHSRIYNDPRMPRERADHFYKTLTERFLDNRGSTVFVAKVDDKPVGFVIGKEDEKLGQAGGLQLGYLWLIMVDEKFSGQGLGVALYQAFEQKMRERVQLLEVGTQTHNYSALNIYTRAGLKLVSSIVTFHAWIE